MSSRLNKDMQFSKNRKISEKKTGKNMGISVKLDAFEGPLDLLLQLIDKNKINIYDIPIAMITEQYMAVINSMEQTDMEIMSEFLVMAATLVRIKSAMLLPAQTTEEGEVIDPRAELVERLLEYKMYKYISFELRDKQTDAERVIFKGSSLPEEIAGFKEEINVSDLLQDLTLKKLHEVFNGLVKKKADSIDPIRSKFGNIEREETNLYDRIKELQDYGIKNKRFSFKKYMMQFTSRMDLIVNFLCILELIKMGRIQISQDQLFDDIIINYLADDIIPIGEFMIE